ncbi:MAG: urease accessory protein UreH domain-containing protein, partial [Thermodesulfobacteriota bacterium]
MFELLAPFFIGLVGSVHCLGMCGPLVLAYSIHIRTRGAE